MRRTVGMVLKDWRLRKGYSQLAFIRMAELNVDQSTFSRWESGSIAITIDQLHACCAVLNRQESELIAEAEKRERHDL